MTAAAETSALESRVGHYYQADDTYLVGREKVREYARAVQDYHPAHWDVVAAAELGYSGLVAPLTFTSVLAVHTLQTTVVGVTAEDLDSAIKTAVQNAMMHDVNILAVGESDAAYEKTVRPEGEVRIAEEARPAHRGRHISMM